MSDDKPKKLVLKKFLPYRLSFLAHSVNRKLASLYAKQFDVTPSEWKIMAILSNYPEISAAEVGDRSVQDKVTVSRAVKELTKKGLVHKSISGQDRRRSVLKLTPEGDYIYRQIVPRMLEYETFLCSAISPAEKVKLEQLLDKLTGHVAAPQAK